MKKNDYVTKKDMLQLFQTFQQTFEEKFETFRQEIKNDIIQFKDDILHEIVDLRDDVAVITGYRDMVEDHENRLVKLEKGRVN